MGNTRLVSFEGGIRPPYTDQDFAEAKLLEAAHGDYSAVKVYPEGYLSCGEPHLTPFVLGCVYSSSMVGGTGTIEYLKPRLLGSILVHDQDMDVIEKWTLVSKGLDAPVWMHTGYEVRRLVVSAHRPPEKSN